MQRLASGRQQLGDFVTGLREAPGPGIVVDLPPFGIDDFHIGDTDKTENLECLLDIDALQLEGRRACLTPACDMLYHRARQLLQDSANLERAAGKVPAGWENEPKGTGTGTG